MLVRFLTADDVRMTTISDFTIQTLEGDDVVASEDLDDKTFKDIVEGLRMRHPNGLMHGIMDYGDEVVGIVTALDADRNEVSYKILAPFIEGGGKPIRQGE